MIASRSVIQEGGQIRVGQEPDGMQPCSLILAYAERRSIKAAAERNPAISTLQYSQDGLQLSCSKISSLIL